MLIVANWKAYVDDSEKANKLFVVSKKLSKISKNKIVLAPPAPFLGAFASKNKSRVMFSAQDISLNTGGALTGEITAQAYAAVGATYAIIGHSERRAAGDDYSIVAKKLAHALTHGLVPILCIGEHERDGEGKYLSYVREELTSALESLTQKERVEVIIAYEPVWAIGANAVGAIQPNDLTEMVLYIRKVLGELLPGKSSAHSLVLYGGSVEPGDIRALAANSGVDGFLVGRASVDPQTFSALVKQLD
jgi:triosephosphate isomerase